MMCFGGESHRLVPKSVRGRTMTLGPTAVEKCMVCEIEVYTPLPSKMMDDWMRYMEGDGGPGL